jgi:Fur family ferric uptake transcriptional regulator
MLHAMDDTLNELKNTGLKATLPRLKILEIFQNSQQRHMTAEDVFRLLLAEHSDIGLATVYRVLTQFEQAACSAAAISRRQGGVRAQRGQHHDHLVCLDCGQVEEFYDAQIEQRQSAIARERGFTLPTTR